MGGEYARSRHDEPDAVLQPAHGIDGWGRFLDTYPELAAVANATGTGCFLVGGSVRDLAAGRSPKDLDITSALTPAQFRERVVVLDESGAAMSVFDVGETHGTTGLAFVRPDGQRIDIEHTTHRAEHYEPGSRSPITTFGTDLRADLDRRDFTMNAVAINIVSGEVVDPHCGLADLKRGVLRTPLDPHTTFSEDPLRISRLIRFASTRGLVIDPDVGVAATSMSGRLGIVSAERKRDELCKVIAAGKQPLRSALDISQQLGVRADVFCGLGDLAEPDDFDRLPKCSPDDLLAALAYRSSDAAGSLRSLKFTNHQSQTAMAAVAGVGHLDTMHHERRLVLRRLGAPAMESANRISLGGGRSVDRYGEMVTFLRSNDGFDTRPLPVDGRDAMTCGLSGKTIGAALKQVEKAMCSSPNITRDECLRILREAL